MEIQEKKINIDDTDSLALLGFRDSNLQLLENKFNSNITVRGTSIILQGDPDEIKIIEKVIGELKYILKRSGALTSIDVNTVLELLGERKQNGEKGIKILKEGDIYITPKEVIRARNERQLEYLRKVRENDVVFSIGSAGTGKTFLAVAMALAALRNGEVNRIVLARPAVEAGESLGFLPGDLADKVDPYLRPLLDALSDMLTPEKLKAKIDKRVVEVIPLAFMRGRTLNNSFVILDEAQNATITQMKMFLTRLGRHSKAIVTGDITQIDLPKNIASGLIDAQYVLKGIEGIDFCYFEKEHVVRAKLVANIIHAYEIREAGLEETNQIQF